MYTIKGYNDGRKRRAEPVADSLVEHQLAEKEITPFNKELYREVWLELEPGRIVQQRVRVERLDHVKEPAGQKEVLSS